MSGLADGFPTPRIALARGVHPPGLPQRVEGDNQKIVAKRVGDCPAELTDGQMKDGKMGMIYSVLMR